MVRVVRDDVVVIELTLVELKVRIEDLFPDEKLAIGAECLVV